MAILFLLEKSQFMSSYYYNNPSSLDSNGLASRGLQANPQEAKPCCREDVDRMPCRNRWRSVKEP